MNEVAELEKDGGYQFLIYGERRSFAGTIAFVSGDNLALQEIGGFKVGPGSNKKCRECMGNTNDIKTKVRYNDSEYYNSYMYMYLIIKLHVLNKLNVFK